MNLKERLDDSFIGAEVEISEEFRKGKSNTKANIYEGFTYGCLSDEEEAIVFDRQLPFIGIDRKYIKRKK